MKYRYVSFPQLPDSLVLASLHSLFALFRTPFLLIRLLRRPRRIRHSFSNRTPTSVRVQYATAPYNLPRLARL